MTDETRTPAEVPPPEEPRYAPDVHKAYENQHIRVHWEPKYCIHIGRCFTVSPQVFDPGARPWVDINAADADEVAETVRLCPTGALFYERVDGPQEEPGDETLIEPRPNGPLFLRGRLVIRKPDGSSRQATRAALCRCGASRNKPFCDSSHRAIGFEAEGTTAL